MRPPDLSPPERLALGLALGLLALHALGLADPLEYRRTALATQPWRALTGHLVHVNWLHALVNGAALWVVARLYATEMSAARLGLALATSALAVSLALYCSSPDVHWYRGLSGALHGVYFAGATTWLLSERPRIARRLWMPVALAAGGWAKVLVEQPGAGTLTEAAWLGAAVVPAAHLAGAVFGTALGALFAATQVRGEQQRRER